MQRDQLVPEDICPGLKPLWDINPPAVVRVDQRVGDPILEGSHTEGEVGQTEENGIASINGEEAQSCFVDIAAACWAGVGISSEVGEDGADVGLGPAVPLEVDPVARCHWEMHGSWDGAPMAYHVGVCVVDGDDVVVRRGCQPTSRLSWVDWRGCGCCTLGI